MPGALRIAILTREFPPVTSYFGGIGTQYAALAGELARQGHDVTVITGGEHSSRQIEHQGLSVVVMPRVLPERLWFLEDLAWSRAVRRRLGKLERFDVVFCAEWGGEAWSYARAGTRSGPLVTNLTSSLEQILAVSPGWRRDRRQRLRHLIQKRLERGQTERSDGLIASSNDILRWARELWKIDSIPTAVVPNMIDAARVRRLSQGEPPAGFPSGGPIVAFSGRVEVRKGVIVLAQAMLEVWKRQPQAQLVLLGHEGAWGDGGMGAHLIEIVGEQRDKLHLLGHQPPERLFPALAAADVIALPSLWENLALAAIEAMAIGTPIVLTETGGFPDIFERDQDGLMVPPGDAGALAGAICRLLGDPDLGRRFAANANLDVERKLNSAEVTRGYLGFFEKIARG